LEGFLALQELMGQKNAHTFFDETQLQIQPSMTYMVQMILSKPLFIIDWMYQEII
jgi:hypothetical protein